MARSKSSRVNREYKTKYRVRNWNEYECGLRSRGDVRIWLREAAGLHHHHQEGPTGLEPCRHSPTTLGASTR